MFSQSNSLEVLLAPQMMKLDQLSTSWMKMMIHDSLWMTAGFQNHTWYESFHFLPSIFRNICLFVSFSSHSMFKSAKWCQCTALIRPSYCSFHGIHLNTTFFFSCYVRVHTLYILILVIKQYFKASKEEFM